MAFAAKEALIIPQSKTGASDLTNFPVLVSVTLPELKTSAPGFVTSASGYDIGFYSGSHLTVKLNWELISFNGSTGALLAWVQVPTLLHLTDTVFYMAFGDASITTDQSNKAGTWDSNYVGVYHMDDNAASTVVVDSTGVNNGTAAANTSTKSTAAQVGNGLTFNGSSDKITTSLVRAVAFTWEAWVNVTSFSSYQTTISIDGANYILFDTMVAGAGSFWSVDGLGGGNQGMTGMSNATWYHIAMVREGNSITNGYKFYLNGVAKTPANTVTLASGNTITIGNRPDTGQWFSGKMDEVRLSNTNRSADWLLACYNNQSSPGTFVLPQPYSMLSRLPAHTGNRPRPFAI